MTDVTAAANPSNLAAVTGPVVDKGTGVKLLQPTNEVAKVAAIATTGTTLTTPYGFTTAAQGDALVAAVNSIITALVTAGIMKPA